MSINITYTPQRSDAVYTHSTSGDVLTVNGESFDFTALAEGDVLPRSAITDASGDVAPWLGGAVTRSGGVVQVTMIEPHGPEGQA